MRPVTVFFADRDPASLARIARQVGCDILVCGHTHQPWTRDIEGVRFVNDGSADATEA